MLLLSLLLSFFSFPLSNFLRFIYLNILPDYGDGRVALLIIVISLNVTALIIALYQLRETKITK